MPFDPTRWTICEDEDGWWTVSRWIGAHQEIAGMVPEKQFAQDFADELNASDDARRLRLLAGTAR